MLCLVEELIRFYVETLNTILANEMVVFNEVSLEEWELVKRHPKEIAKAMISQIRMAFESKGACGNCSRWGMTALEMKDGGRVNDLEVGSWEPTQGLALKDDLFPHVNGGLRGRNIVVNSIDVSYSHTLFPYINVISVTRPKK